MPSVAVDPYTIVWYLSNDKRLSAKAMNALDSAAAAGQVIYVPSICLVELTYLVEKGRLPSLARARHRALNEAVVRVDSTLLLSGAVEQNIGPVREVKVFDGFQTKLGIFDPLFTLTVSSSSNVHN